MCFLYHFLKVWRGAFLLADYIIEYSQEYFAGKNILELGSGTGLTSIVAAIYANKVYATGIQLKLCVSIYSISILDYYLLSIIVLLM